MLNAITKASPLDVELPKSSLNSSKDASVTDIYMSHTEDIYLKYTSKDGDVLELTAHTSEELFYHGENNVSADNYDKTARCGKHGELGKPAGTDASDGTDSADETDPAKKAWSDVRAWAQRIHDELKAQQKEVFAQALKNHGHTVEAGEGKFLTLDISVTDGTKKPSDSDATAQVPDYWNAENTSDRIVHMATSFAKISGLDPREFGEKIRAAITKGFDSAHAVTGNLPGAAGKLNKDTKDLVFTKLTKWLEDWEAGAYNQSAQANANQTTEVTRGTSDNQ